MTDTTEDQKQLLTFKDLKALGWPYCRTQTVRKMAKQIQVTRDRGRRTEVIDNPDPFPQATKLGWHPNSPLVWKRDEVIAYFKRHGITVH